MGVRSRRRERPAADGRSRPGIESGILPRRRVDRVQRAVRGEHRRLHRSSRRRRAAAAHVASGRRSRAGVHARRKVGRVQVGTRLVHESLHPAVHRAGRRRHRAAAADSARFARELHRRRRPNRLQPAAAGFSAMEALPRRRDVGSVHLPRRRSSRGQDSPAVGTRQRCRSGVDRRHGLFPIGPQRRVQPVLVRAADQSRHAADASRRLPRALARRRRRPRGVRTGRLSPLVGSRGEDQSEADHRRRRRSRGDPAALRQRREVRAERGAVAVWRTRGVRLPRRDRHRACGKRRRAQPDRHGGHSRAQPGVVAELAERLAALQLANTSSSSRRRTARASAGITSRAAPATTNVRSGRPTAGSSRSSTIRSACTSSISRPA